MLEQERRADQSAVGAINRPLRRIRKDAEPSYASRQQGRRPLSKNRITKMSMPLPRIPPPIVDDDDVTLKASAIKLKLPLPSAQDVDEETLKASAIKLPLYSAQDVDEASDDDEISDIDEASDDDEASKEALAARPTHLMPVSPRRNATVTREAVSAQYIDALAAASEAYASAEQPVRGQRVLPALPFFVGSWKFSRLLLILIVLAPFTIGGGVLAAAQLNQRQQSLYQVNARTGAMQWQQTLPAEADIAHVDAQGSLLNVTTGQGLHQIVALNRNNVTLWKSAQSQNSFSLFPDASPARTVLIALSGTISVSNAMNGTTATYLQPLVFSLVDRQSGRTLWQKTLVSSQQQQGGAILGVDSRYIYVALAQIKPASHSTTQGTQLLALNRLTGQVAWHITDPAQVNDIPQDAGQLLLQQHLLIWQVAGTIYAIDTTDAAAASAGKVLWHESLAETSMQQLPQEEAQMSIAGRVLLIERNDAFHALDPLNGTILWDIANPGFALTFITSYNNIVLLYGNGAIEALDTNTQQIMWSQQQLDAIQNLQISDDGTLAYATTTDSIEGSSPAQALVAIDMKNGSVHWTFQPSAQVTFIPLQTSGIFYNRGIVLTSFCSTLPPTPCTQQFLYALNATTGAVIWKYVGNSISDVQISNDGTAVLFQRNSSAWLDLTERFKNT
ncbi:MAG: PQQ-binding-like beta-propeller repeat protein [Ktedonobacteraceae bacterium]